MDLTFLNLIKDALLHIVADITFEQIFEENDFEDLKRLFTKDLGLIANTVVQVKVDNPYDVDEYSSDNRLYL